MDTQIVEFFFKNKKTALAIKYAITYIFSLYVFGMFLNYFLTKNIDFDVNIWIDNFKNNQKIIIIMFMTYTMVLMVAMSYFYNKYQELKRKNDVIILKLEDIAYTWVNDKKTVEKQEEVEKQEATEQTVNNTDKIYLEHLKYITFKDFELKRFFATVIIKNAQEFSKDEISIVLDILKLLDEHGAVSSVAAKYTKDSELEWMNQIQALNDYKSKEKNYILLSKINMKTHTINVADFSVEAFLTIKKENENEVALIDLPIVVIAALAHDIGKITKQVSDIISTPEHIMFLNNHASMSVEYFESIGKNYSRKDSVKEAIRAHHRASVPEDMLSKIIYQSDKKARDKESAEIIEKLKQTNEHQTDEKRTTNDSKESIVHKYEDDVSANIIVDKIVSTMKQKLNQYKSIVNGKMVVATKDLTSNHVQSISSEVNAYYTYTFLKEIIESAMGKKMQHEEIKGTVDLLTKEGIVVLNGGVTTKEVKVYFFDNMLFASYMVVAPLEKLGISKEESMKNIASVYKTEGIYVKE